ncbi:MAG: restriction endonuclease subunit M [Lachnospiraceae bacterium]|nr:restriction endonuclease subunit M [Lachnospiraceae bacterium]
MSELIDLKSYPVSVVLKELLKDKTTKKNIIFATDAYVDFNIDVKDQITEDVLLGFGALAIQPRVLKTFQEQSERTKKKAEVFTPSWICNKMNNHCDAEWFGREEVFNREVDHTWVINVDKIEFAKPKDWQKYVDSKRLEITCGEAPYIVSRYDTTTAEIIPVRERIGILDRKLRIVNENTDNEKDWIKWAMRAFQSVYGYEFQGDNLLIARINLLMTFVEYMNDRWEHDPDDEDLKKITNIIVWNLWQMDGITGTIPFGKPKEEYQQLSLFDYAVGINDTEPEEVNCKIFDWRSNESLTYNSMKRG